jgi:bis(5'-nucleosyl)-tetraphosphatase (symmetrical)
MSTYAIGDIQGCFSALERLLIHIKFNPAADSLWFTGDLVNRGPQSLETLRFIKQLGKNHHVVLGNHDLHLLAVAHGARLSKKEDTLAPILAASDGRELLMWLQHQPLIHHDEKLGFTMVHASLASSWDLITAIHLSREVETVLQNDQAVDFFHHMFGNEPHQWHDGLVGWDRLRCITNYFTRARFCFADGSLELENKGALGTQPENLLPWFLVRERRNTDLKIIFGHWAALDGDTQTDNTFALDTGCIWGGKLTALRLEDEQRFQVAC